MTIGSTCDKPVAKEVETYLGEPSPRLDEALTWTLVLLPGDGFKVPQEQRDDRGLALRSVLKGTVGQVRARDKQALR